MDVTARETTEKDGSDVVACGVLLIVSVIVLLWFVTFPEKEIRHIQVKWEDGERILLWSAGVLYGYCEDGKWRSFDQDRRRVGIADPDMQRVLTKEWQARQERKKVAEGIIQ